MMAGHFCHSHTAAGAIFGSAWHATAHDSHAELATLRQFCGTPHYPHRAHTRHSAGKFCAVSAVLRKPLNA